MKQPEETFTSVELYDFLVRYEENEGWYTGTVYPIQRWSIVSSEETGWSYISDKSSDMVESLEEGVRIMFEFRFVWRGVWDGRIYFKDDEYYSGELRTMHRVWEQLEEILKDKIRKNEPDREFED